MGPITPKKQLFAKDPHSGLNALECYVKWANLQEVNEGLQALFELGFSASGAVAVAEKIYITCYELLLYNT